MFENGFPREWSTIKKLALLFRAVVNAVAPVLKTVTGAIIHITDALARPAQSLKVNFSPVQSGSGDPSPDNVRPISGWTECKVTRTGKNLFDKSKVGTLGTITWAYESGFVLKGGQSYTLSVESTGSSGLFDSIGIYGTDKSTQYAISYQRTLTYTPVANTVVVFRFYKNTSVTQAAVDTIQLELGSTVTAYEAFQGQTYTIDLNGTRYGGTLDVTSGKLTVDRAMVTLNGTQRIAWANWRATDTSTAWQYGAEVFDAKKVATNVRPNIISDKLTAVIYNQMYTGVVSNAVAVNTNVNYSIIVRVDDTSLTTENAINAYLSANPIQVVYELATPIEVDLTPTEITLFADENNLCSDANGDLELTYLADGNTSEIEALNILLGGQYSNNHGEDEPTDREALNILLGGNER